MEQLQYQLKSIRLSGMANALSTRLQEARANELPHQDFLTNLVQDELERRQQNLLNRRLKAARFPEQKTLDEFDFTFNPGLNKRFVLDLASCRFVVKSQNALMVGPPGVGKSHLAIAVGIAAIHHGYAVLYRSIFDLVEELAEAQILGERPVLIKKLVKPDLLILDEFGMRNLADNAAEDLLEIFHRRYHKGSCLIATNRPIEDWGKLLGDTAATSAILDRLLEDAFLLKITGRSYRLRTMTQKDENQKTVAKEQAKS